MNSSTSTWGLWNEACQAIRSNFFPGLFLWAVAAMVVGLYYGFAEARPIFTLIAQWKASGGFFYSVVSTALFAGLIPLLFLKILRSTRASATWGTLAFLVVFWGYRGFEIDLLYRIQGWLFGIEPTPATVSAKVAFDLFVYNVFWAASLQLLTYHWKNRHFRVDAFDGFPWKTYVQRRLPVALMSTWAVWLPVLILVYSLPSDLQIPLFNLAACFWSLVMATLTKPQAYA